MVGASLLADPGVQGSLDRVAVVVGESESLAASAASCVARSPGWYCSRTWRCRWTVLRFWRQRSAISRTVRPAAYIISHSGCPETSQPANC